MLSHFKMLGNFKTLIIGGLEEKQSIKYKRIYSLGITTRIYEALLIELICVHLKRYGFGQYDVSIKQFKRVFINWVYYVYCQCEDKVVKKIRFYFGTLNYVTKTNINVKINHCKTNSTLGILIIILMYNFIFCTRCSYITK